MSRRLLATRIAQASAPQPIPASTDDHGDLLGLHVRRPDRRDQTEEHEDRHLAEPAIAVRRAPAGVEPRRHDAGGADEQQPPRDQSARAPARRPPRRRTPRSAARLTARRRCDARADEPQRPDPVGVGAAHPVAVVVGVVDRRPAARARRAGRAGPTEARTRRPRPPRRCRPRPARWRRAGCGVGRPRATATPSPCLLLRVRPRGPGAARLASRAGVRAVFSARGGRRRGYAPRTGPACPRPASAARRPARPGAAAAAGSSRAAELTQLLERRARAVGGLHDGHDPLAPLRRPAADDGAGSDTAVPDEHPLDHRRRHVHPTRHDDVVGPAEHLEPPSAAHRPRSWVTCRPSTSASAVRSGRSR